MAGQSDILAGKWNEMKGNMRTWFGKLTDDDIQQIQGNRDKLYGILQQRYGWNRMKAEEELNRHLTEYEREHPGTIVR